MSTLSGEKGELGPPDPGEGVWKTNLFVLKQDKVKKYREKAFATKKGWNPAVGNKERERRPTSPRCDGSTGKDKN